MSAYEDWVSGDANPEVKLNALADSIGQGLVFAERPAAHTGLTVGYGGGTFDVNTVADGTVAGLTNNTTNYLVVHRTTRAVTSSTATTNWNNTTTYGRMARAVFASSVLTWHDERYSVGGIFDRSNSSGGLLAANNLSDVANAATARTNLGVDSAIAAAVAGLSWKQAVRAASTAAQVLATDFENGDTIDGVVLATGNRILVKNQATATENGIYVVAASGAPARATDADSGAELVNASVYVSEGTTLADTQWTCTTNATITVGATNLAFAQLTSGSGSVATDAIWDVAGDLVYGTGANTAARLPVGTGLQQLRVNAGATAPEWFTPSTGATDPLFSGSAMDQIPPTTNFGTLDTQANGLPCIDFDGGSTNEASRWLKQLPFGWAGSTLTITVINTMTSATSGNVRWGARVMRLNADISVDSFDTAIEAHTAVAADIDDPTTTTLSAVTVDGAAAGEWILVEVYRDASDTANDTASGDAELLCWHAR